MLFHQKPQRFEALHNGIGRQSLGKVMIFAEKIEVSKNRMVKYGEYLVYHEKLMIWGEFLSPNTAHRI